MKPSIRRLELVYFFLAPAASAAFFASARIYCQDEIPASGGVCVAQDVPAACFSLIFAATFSFSRCISEPDMLLAFFYRGRWWSAR